MINDEILQYAGELLRERVLGHVLVRKITVWGRTTDSPFVSIRVEQIPLSHEAPMWGAPDESVSIPGELIGPLSEESTKQLLSWVIWNMRTRIEKRGQRYTPQPGTIEIVPIEKMNSKPAVEDDE